MSQDTGLRCECEAGPATRPTRYRTAQRPTGQHAAWLSSCAGEQSLDHLTALLCHARCKHGPVGSWLTLHAVPPVCVCVCVSAKA